MPSPPTPTPRPPVRGVLACWTCHRVEACSRAELLRFAQVGWPECCGEVMALVTDPPTADDTLADPPLPTG